MNTSSVKTILTPQNYILKSPQPISHPINFSRGNKNANDIVRQQSILLD